MQGSATTVAEPGLAASIIPSRPSGATHWHRCKQAFPEPLPRYTKHGGSTCNSPSYTQCLIEILKARNSGLLKTRGAYYSTGSDSDRLSAMRTASYRFRRI